MFKTSFTEIIETGHESTGYRTVSIASSSKIHVETPSLVSALATFDLPLDSSDSKWVESRL